MSHDRYEYRGFFLKSAYDPRFSTNVDTCCEIVSGSTKLNYAVYRVTHLTLQR
jgi:hypothetical protein